MGFKERVSGTVSMKNSLVMVVGGVGVALVAGCAGAGASVRTESEELRGSAVVRSGEARPLVTGPIRLLHVNTEGRLTPKYSRVWVRGGAGDCRKGTPLEWNGSSAVQIEKDEMVCVETARSARVSWHGQTVPAASSSLVHQVSLR